MIGRSVSNNHIDHAGVAELVDARDLKSLSLWLCGFDPRRPHHLPASWRGQPPGYPKRKPAIVADDGFWFHTTMRGNLVVINTNGQKTI